MLGNYINKPLLILFLICFTCSSITAQSNGQTSGIEDAEGEFVDEDDIGLFMCSMYSGSLHKPNQMKYLEEAVLKRLGKSIDDKDSKKIFGKFLNDNHNRIICHDDHNGNLRPKEPLIKRTIGRGEYGLIDSLMIYEAEYGYNLNHFEIVDGRKETILDYIEKILNDPELLSKYNADKLRLLHSDFIDYDAKRGSEL